MSISPVVTTSLDGYILRENKELKEENERLKQAILKFGNGNDFDWNVLAEMARLEEENKQLKASMEANAPWEGFRHK